MRLRFLVTCVVLGGLLLTDLNPVAAATDTRPDGSIRQLDEAGYVGRGVYNTTGVGQTRERLIGVRGRGTFVVELRNNGAAGDDLRVQGSSHSVNFSVQYRLSGVDVSDDVKAGRLVLRNMGPGGTRTLTISVATRRSVPKGTSHTVRLRSVSIASGRVDTVRAVVRRPLYSEDQLTVASQINASRAAAGRARLTMNSALATKAQAWSRHLAQIGRLEHSNLSAGAPGGWQALAENVGYHADLVRMHREFLASSGHRHNLLGSYTHLGTGVTRSGNWFYVVHVFMRS